MKLLISDLVERARVLVGADGALVGERGTPGNVFVLAGTGSLSGIAGSFPVPPDSPTFVAFESGRSTVLGSVELFAPGARELARGLGAESAIYVALRGRTGPIAVLAVLSHRPNAFTDRHLAQLEGAAEGIGALLESRTPVQLRELREHVAMVESQNRFRAFLDAMPALAWVKDHNRRYVAVNDNFARRIGRTPEALVGLRSADVFGTDEARLLTEHEDPALAGASFEGEEHVTLEGVTSTFWTTRFPIAAANGVRHFGGMAVDITGMKRAEQALARSHETLRLLVEQLPVGVIIHRAGVLCLVNEAAARLVGAPPVTELIGRRVDEFIAADQPQFELDVQRLKEERVGRSQTEVRRPDGSRALLRTVTTPIDYDGAPAMAVILHDVTEDQRRQAQLQVTGRLASVGTLAAAVAHEINNPLSYVLTNLHLISEELEGEGLRPLNARTMIDDACVGVERIRLIVRALSSLASTQPQVPHPIELRVVIDGALQLVGKALREHACVEVELGPMPLVAADEPQLTQVLVNLLTNAAQAVAAAPGGDHRVVVRGFTDPVGRAVLEVVDDGVGIARGNLERIFDPFFTTRPVGEGTGLGLSMAHRIVTSLQGTLTVDSQFGKGATFRLVLPPTRVPALTPVVAPRTRGKVLVVDDDALLGKVLARSLQKAHDPVVVQSAAAALVELERQPFDLVFTDLMMPDTDGIELYEEIGRRFPALAPRVVFISGGTWTARANDFLQRVPNHRLDKPLDLPQVLKVVADILAGRVSREQA